MVIVDILVKQKVRWLLRKGKRNYLKEKKMGLTKRIVCCGSEGKNGETLKRSIRT